MVYHVLHLASPQFIVAKYFIISHVAFKYTWIKKHSSFSFVALLIMSRFAEQSGAFGMLKAGVRVLTSPDIVIAIRQLYSASEIVSRLLGQLRIDADLVSQEWRPALKSSLRRLFIDDIYIDDIRSGQLLSVPDE